MATLFVVVASARAELRIEVTQGVDDPVRVAIVPFGWAGNIPPDEDVAGVVASDLLLSGRFEPLPVAQMLSLPSNAQAVAYRDWRLLDQAYVVVGELRPQAGRLRLTFSLLDVLAGQVELTQSIEGQEDELRDMAHHVSDVVYERLTGIEGAFSTEIMYVTALGEVDNPVFTLTIADADGHRPREILRSSEPILSAVWSPGGRRIAYVSFERDGRPAIFLRDLAANTVEQLTAYPGLNSAPAFSPDGRRLAMTLSRDGNPEIYMMDLDSREMRRLTRHYSIDTEPSFTPDGDSVIFTSNRGGMPQIYMLGIDSMKVERLTFEGDYNARARMLPDGNGMVFVHRRDGIFHIALMDLARGRYTVLTETMLDESPSVAPNGSMLIYATRDRGRGILAAVAVDGGVKFRLPATEGDVREPAWSSHKRRVFVPVR